MHPSLPSLSKGSRTFWFASLFLPRSLRREVEAVYAWYRFTDDLGDNPALSPSQKSQALAKWGQETFRAFEQPEQASPLLQNLVAVFQRYQLKPYLLGDLLRGLQEDQKQPHGFNSLEELEEYCYCVAGSVGLVMAPLLGSSGLAALPHACQLGKAMQMTNIARDLGEDSALGRLYLPRNWLMEVQVAPEQLLDPLFQGRIFYLVQRLLARADDLYRQGLTGISYLPRSTRLTILLAATWYREIGYERLRQGPASLGVRSIVSRARQLQLLFPTTWRWLTQ